MGPPRATSRGVGQSPTLVRSGSIAHTLQHAADHFAGVEVFLREVPGQLAMPLVVGCQRLQRAHGFGTITKPEQPFSGGQEAAGTGMLDDRRLAARQIAQSAITDPGILQENAGGFRTTELAQRLLDVLLIIPRSRGHFTGVADSPPFFEQQLPLCSVALALQINRELERLTRPLWEIEKRQEALAFSIVVRLPAPGQSLVAPVSDCCVGRLGRGSGDGPGCQTDGWRRVVPPNSAAGEEG